MTTAIDKKISFPVGQPSSQPAGHRVNNMASKWQPILDDESRQEALKAVWEIAEALPSALTPKAIWNTDEPTGFQLTMLVSWKAEAALFYAYLAEAFNHSGFADKAWSYLNEAVGEVAEHITSSGLFSGFTEIGWIIANLANLKGTILTKDETENCEVIDQALKQHLNQTDWQSHYDLVAGLAGYGVYALERLPHLAAVEISTKVVSKLWETAEHGDLGITWHSGPALLSEWQLKLCPNGYYNLGLAHGVPGVIGLLGRNIAAGIETERSQILLEGAVRWLLAHRRPADCESSFTSWAGVEIEQDISKIAWCYGDLGIGTALLYAAKCTSDAQWERAAIAILRKAADRPYERAGVFDVCLCHGAAGNAHIFNRVYQASGDQRFKSAALAWYERALRLRQPSTGIGGFSIGDVDEVSQEMIWVNKPGLLDGIAGVGLALLAACTGLEPRWDRSMLISIPPKSK